MRLRASKTVSLSTCWCGTRAFFVVVFRRASRRPKVGRCLEHVRPFQKQLLDEGRASEVTAVEPISNKSMRGRGSGTAPSERKGNPRC